MVIVGGTINAFSGQLRAYAHDSTYSESIIVRTENVPIKHDEALNEYATTGASTNPQQYTPE